MSRTTKAALAVAAALACAPAGAQAATLYVDDDVQDSSCVVTGGFYLEIQDAIDAAAPNDTIRVCPGRYSGDIQSSKAGLQILGPKAGVDPATRSLTGGGGEAVVQGFNGFDVFGTEALVDGFTVLPGEDGSNTGIGVFGAGATARNNVVTRMGFGIAVESGASAVRNRVTGTPNSIAGIAAKGQNARILSNRVSDVGGYGIVVNGGALGAEVRNNVLSNNATSPSDISGAADAADCRDFTKGTGTAGTASIWSGNTGAKSSKPAGLCPLPAPVICPGIGVLNPVLGSPLRTIGTVVRPIDPLIRAICGV